MLYGTAPYYGTGARADARIRTSVRIRVSILKPGTASFLKLKSKKKHTWVHLKVARAHFSFKISCLKFFLKLLCVTRTRIRILGSGSVKNSSKQKMQMIPDPDEVRIRESYQTKGECLRIRILESGFGTFMRTPDPHRIRTGQYGSTPLVPIGPFSCVCKGTRHLDYP